MPVVFIIRTRDKVKNDSFIEIWRNAAYCDVSLIARIFTQSIAESYLSYLQSYLKYLLRFFLTERLKSSLPNWYWHTHRVIVRCVRIMNMINYFNNILEIVMHQNLNPNEIFFSIKEQRNFKPTNVCMCLYSIQITGK